MRILVLGPDHTGGSLPPYLDALSAGLRQHGATVDRHGSVGVPYDRKRQEFQPIGDIAAQADALLDRIDLGDYDVLSVHFGNLEVEQLLPVLWAGRPHPPAVYHVHTLAPTLLRDHVPDPQWYSTVRKEIRRFDGYVYFGQHARAHLAGTVSEGAPSGMAWLPTTIPDKTEPRMRPELAAALDTDGIPVISLYGYAAPWKDAALLYAAARLMDIPARIVLAGDFWTDPAQAGIDLGHTTTPVRLGAAEFVIVPGYLGPSDRIGLARASRAAVFPYRAHPSFQGSGAIADYLAHAVPVVATDVANMAELVADAGRIVPAGDAHALARALDTVAANGVAASRYIRRAQAYAHRFSAGAHAGRCLDVYRRVSEHQQRRIV